MDVITCECDKFFSDRLRDIDSVGVKNEGFPLTKAVPVSTGLRNCGVSLCDNTANYESPVSVGKRDKQAASHLTPPITLIGFARVAEVVLVTGRFLLAHAVYSRSKRSECNAVYS